MKKILIVTLFFGYFTPIVYSQSTAETRYQEALEAFKNKDFSEVLLLLEKIKPTYKKVPPKIWFLEIVAKAEIINANPYESFQLIENTRRLARSYLTENKARQTENYRSVQKILEQLSQYPKDLAAFNRRKEEIQIEKERAEEARIKAEADAEARRIKIEEQRKAAETLRIQQEQARIQAQKDAAIEAEKRRIAERQVKASEVNVESVDPTTTQSKKRSTKVRSSLSSFRSIGIQSGEIAKYGLQFESGGDKVLGLRIVARSSMTPNEEVGGWRDYMTNKSEVELGTNFRILKPLYLNVGGGYGFYRYNQNNGSPSGILVKQTYVVTSAGIMVRFGNKVNINGGVSFMDIDENLNNPEITFGVSYNLKTTKTSYTKVARTKRSTGGPSPLTSFTSLGLQSGEIAKFGLLFETGGRKFIGLRMVARSSMTSEEDVLNGYDVPNKSEAELGLNFKVLKFLYLNLGGGYGYHLNAVNYSGVRNVEQQTYWLASAGMMLRAGNRINVNAGASFMDPEKDLNQPEITFGISYNLKR